MKILELGTSGTVGTSLMGPVSTVTCELSNRFAARGHEVTLVDFRNEGSRPLLHPAIQVVELPALPPKPSTGPGPGRIGELYQTWSRSLRFARQLRSKVDLSQADVVH